MKQNVVWWPAVKNPDHSGKYGNYDYFEYSRKTWEYWCKKNDVIFLPFEVPVKKDLSDYRVNWQKALFVFDELERQNIEYDQIALIDSTVMIKWDAPNFFNLTDKKFTVTRDRDNMNWVHKSIQGYKEFFNNFELDQSKYFRSGFMVFNETHKFMFDELKQTYINNKETFKQLQDVTVRKGNDQTPINYLAQINKIDLKFLPGVPWMCSHIHKKELFGHNWQTGDNTLHLIKHGYMWMFNGIPKEQRSNVMKQVWEMVSHYYDEFHILNKISNKNYNKNTTSGKFKEDIYKIFSDPKFKDMTMLELGCHQGNTTRIYAECFNKVIAVEISGHNLELAKQACSDVDNVEFIQSDVYDPEFKIPAADIMHLDAGHTYDQVSFDIDRCVALNNPIIIMDDFGHEGRTVRNAIINKMKENKLELHQYIGEDKGYIASNDKVFIGREGCIFNYK
tara:strand:+ start:687 stop:2033 length:1347 start_codon:yes stop_codon:yes gene_type:complete